MKTSLIAVLFTCIASISFANQIGGFVQSDLNKDGLVERFYLLDSGNGTVNLLIENTGGGVIFAGDIAWIGGIGQQPELSLAANGSVKLVSMNEAIGRNRWHKTLTIAFRDGTYRVAGMTYDWYDTLELSDNGECDLNLLNGKGFLTRDGNKSAVRTKLTALPVTAWKDGMPLPPACGF